MEKKKMSVEETREYILKLIEQLDIVKLRKLIVYLEEVIMNQEGESEK